MPQFNVITPLTAGNFNSEAATDGQVLTADGAGGAAFEDAAGGAVLPSSIDSSYSPAGSILVSGAGTAAANAIYYIAGTQDGKNYYYNDTTSYGIYWIPAVGETPGYWDVENDSLTSLYTAEEDVLTPDLVEGGWFASGGAEPAPTVSAYTNYPAGSTLQADGSGAGVFVLTAQLAYDSATLVDNASGVVAVDLYKDGVELTTGTYLLHLFFTNDSNHIVDSSIVQPNLSIKLAGLISDPLNTYYSEYIFLWIAGSGQTFGIFSVTGTCYVNLVLPTGAIATSNAVSAIPPP